MRLLAWLAVASMAGCATVDRARALEIAGAVITPAGAMTVFGGALELARPTPEGSGPTDATGVAIMGTGLLAVAGGAALLTAAGIERARRARPPTVSDESLQSWSGR
jgi:hypothetical protein